MRFRCWESTEKEESCGRMVDALAAQDAAKTFGLHLFHRQERDPAYFFEVCVRDEAGAVKAFEVDIEISASAFAREATPAAAAKAVAG